MDTVRGVRGRNREAQAENNHQYLKVSDSVAIAGGRAHNLLRLTVSVRVQRRKKTCKGKEKKILLISRVSTRSRRVQIQLEEQIE